jgi:hypothetical protein
MKSIGKLEGKIKSRPSDNRAIVDGCDKIKKKSIFVG